MESPENLHGPAVGVGQDATPTTVDVDTAVFLLGAGVTTLTHPLLYVKLLIQHIVKVDGKRGLLRGLSPRIVSSAISTVVRSKVKQFSQASAVRSYTKFVMGIAVSVLTYPFMLVADLMVVNNCGLAAGLPPLSPVFSSWLHCWNHLSNKGHLFRGSSFFFRRVPLTSIED